MNDVTFTDLKKASTEALVNTHHISTDQEPPKIPQIETDRVPTDENSNSTANLQ